MSKPIYNPDRTFAVDSNVTNHTFLIRGNQPLTSDGISFAYNELAAKLKTILSKDLKSGDFDLTKYTLIDISLIDDVVNSERPVLEAEFGNFGIDSKDFDKLFPGDKSWPPFLNGYDLTKKYGTQVTGEDGAQHNGSIVWYPVQGCTGTDNCKAVEPTQYNFSGLVDFLKQLMQNGSYLVIYYHCEHGHDRTSALTGAYMLKYMNRTLDQVLNDHPPMGAKAFKHEWEVNYKELVKYYAGTL